MHHPKVTIVTVVYNDINNIELTMKSVLEQDYPNIEYVIIDGGSTDGTKEFLMSYESHFACFISERDNGIYDAMNKGISFATGGWILFMNSGDVFFDKSVISRSFSSYDIDKYDVIFGNTKSLFSSYNIISCPILPTLKDPMPFCHQSVFVRTNLLKTYMFDLKYKFCSDRDLFYKLFINKSSYKYMNFVFSQINAVGYSNLKPIKTITELNFITKKYDSSSNLICLKRLLRAYFTESLKILVGKRFFSCIQRIFLLKIINGNKK